MKEIKLVLSSSLCRLQILKIQLYLNQLSFNHLPPTSYVLQTVNPNVCINTFSCPTDKFVTEILNLLHRHVQLSPAKSSFVILNHLFDTYHTLQKFLQQIATITKTHFIYDTCKIFSQKELILLEVPSQFAKTS